MSWFSQAVQGVSQQGPPAATTPPVWEGLSGLSLGGGAGAGGGGGGGGGGSSGNGGGRYFSIPFPHPPVQPQPPQGGPEHLPPLPGPEYLPYTSFSRPSAPPRLSDLPQGPPPSGAVWQEQRCVLGWLQGWGASQRGRFLQDLLSKAVPGKVCTLLDQLTTLQVRDRPPSIFECQLRLWGQWFESWSEEERNGFLHCLEEREPALTSAFYREVSNTAGRE
ncbi:uncharacterized protein C14orf119 homolog [Amia ocellicauda]|uniref:uncharacterized protein C14orf119 homolog n=1 Tax=Amia ocellicauda TaxID=2972642 RepID=UPI003464A9DE